LQAAREGEEGGGAGGGGQKGGAGRALDRTSSRRGTYYGTYTTEEALPAETAEIEANVAKAAVRRDLL
jgi:hypothetical protein